MVLHFLPACHEMYKYSFENTHSKDCSESRIKFLFRVFFALMGHFSPVTEYCIRGRFRKNFRITGGFWNYFRVTGGYCKAETSSLKMVPGRIFTIRYVISLKHTENLFWIFLTK
jgi:hypothetical protein